MSGPVLLFDGVCNLCNGMAQFVIRRDPAGRFRLATLQSEAGRSFLERFGYAYDADDLRSFVLVENGRVYERSAAFLRTLVLLGGPWKAASLFLAVPRPLRDAAYSLVARLRYRLFGRTDACIIPNAAERARFLQ